MTLPTGYSALQDIFLDMFPTGYNLQDMRMTYRIYILPTGYHLQDIMCYPQDKNDVHVVDTPNGYKIAPTGHNGYPVGFQVRMFLVL